jgi:hypothetical protein
MPIATRPNTPMLSSTTAQGNRNAISDGDEVITHVELHAAVFEGLEAALVRRKLLRVGASLGFPAPDHDAEGQQHQRETGGDGEENQYRQVVFDHFDEIRAIAKRGSNLSTMRDNRPRKNSGAIVSGINKVMVPTGRLELPRIAPLAPQASVSTNSTTSALSKNRQGFSGTGSVAGAAGTGTEFASTGGGAGAVAGTVVVTGTLSSSDSGVALKSR